MAYELLIENRDESGVADLELRLTERAWPVIHYERICPRFDGDEPLTLAYRLMRQQASRELGWVAYQLVTGASERAALPPHVETPSPTTVGPVQVDTPPAATNGAQELPAPAGLPPDVARLIALGGGQG